MAIIGDNTQGVDAFPCSDGRCLVSRFTASSGGSMNTGYAYFDSGTTSGTSAKVVILADSSSTPGSVIAVSAGAAIPAGGGLVNCGAISGTIVNATAYWIGVVCDNFSAQFSEDVDSPAVDSVMANGTFDYASPPSSWPGTDASYGVTFNAYIDYTESGGATSLPIQRRMARLGSQFR